MSVTMCTGATKRLCHILTVPLFLLAFLPADGSAEEGLADLTSFREGCRALTDERFESSIDLLKNTWSTLMGVGGGDVEKDFVASRLLEAFVRNNESGEAVSWLNEHPLPSRSDKTLYWAAVAQMSEEDFQEAARSFRELLNRQPEPDRVISVALAGCLAASNEPESSWEIVASLGDPESAQEAITFAYIAHRAKRNSAALNYLGFVRDTGKTERKFLFPVTAFRAHLTALEGGSAKEISDLVVQLVESATTEKEALHSFLLFEEVTPTELERWLAKSADKWAEMDGHPAALCHKFFSTLYAPENENSLRSNLLNWAKTFPESITASESILRLAKLADGGAGNPAPSLLQKTTPPDFPGGEFRIRFETALQNFRNGRFDTAASEFLAIADQSKGEDRFRSFFNASICRLKSGDSKGFQVLLARFRTEDPDSPFLADLEFAAGLHLAASGDARSVELLEPFIRENPGHQSLVEAMLTLAEVYLNQVPARPQAASEILEKLRTRPLNLEQSERLDYSGIWLEVIRSNDPAIIAAAKDFLKDWPGSKHVGEVSLLLAQTHYQNNNRKAAGMIFDNIAEQFSGTPIAARARYYAARTNSGEPGAGDNPTPASRWLNIAEEGGTFALEARHELALYHLAHDKFAEARDQFQKVIDGTSPASPLHLAARADFAFTYFAEALSNGHSHEILQKAALAFKELSQDMSLPAAAKHEATVRHGRCLESLGEKTQALDVYQSLIISEDSETLTPVRVDSANSNEWIFRAGFSAIEILRGNKDWKQAIQIADTLAGKDGARAIEASRLAEQMRLKHWVWE